MPMPKEAAWLSKRADPAGKPACRQLRRLQGAGKLAGDADGKGDVVRFLEGLGVHLGEVLGEGWLVLGKASPEGTLWKISSG